MASYKTPKEKNEVGGKLFEELFFEFIQNKYSISKEELFSVLKERKEKKDSIPVSILRSDNLSSLEAIVKFLRENKKLSYIDIGRLLNRNHLSLAVTYSVALRKMRESFSDSVDEDTNRISFTAFNNNLSVLEAICSYLNSIGHSYSSIAKLLGKDQRTIWTVCSRAKKKLAAMDSKKDSKKNSVSGEKNSK